MKNREELVKEIASLIVNNENYVNAEWDSVSVTVCFDPPSIWEGGIMYLGDEYKSKPPAGFDLTNKMVELRDLMTQEEENEWVVCLIKISAQTQSIDMDFEYDDVRRWKLTPTIDPDELRAYAMSIK